MKSLLNMPWTHQELHGAHGGVAYSRRIAAVHATSDQRRGEVACLFNAGEYDNEFVPKLLAYCEKKLRTCRTASSAIGTMRTITIRK